MSIESEDPLNDVSYMFSDMTENLDGLESSIIEYQIAESIYQRRMDQYRQGKTSRHDVKNAMDHFAFTETEMISEASRIGDLAEFIRSDFRDLGPEDVVGLATENVFMDHMLAESSSNYECANDDFLESLERYEDMYRHMAKKGELLRQSDQEEVREKIGYSWREAFANVKDWEEDNTANVFDPENISEKRNDIIAERPRGNYIDFQELSGTEDIAEKREEVLDISDEDLENKRDEVKSREPRYIQ
ncbi:MAG: hypothetical protein R6V35_03515 [Candidatus Nanohaloarchaea archaeon]